MENKPDIVQLSIAQYLKDISIHENSISTHRGLQIYTNFGRQELLDTLDKVSVAPALVLAQQMQSTPPVLTAQQAQTLQRGVYYSYKCNVCLYFVHCVRVKVRLEQ